MFLLLPVANKLDKKHFPYVVITLIIVNFLVFFALQTDDDKRYQTATEYYFSSQIGDIEIPAYIFYLENFKNAHFDNEFYKKIATDSSFQFEFFTLLTTDAIFQIALDKNIIINKEYPNFWEWRTKRDHYQYLLKQNMVYKYGYKAAQSSIISALSSIFLHASLMHVIGNMVFLFIVGVSVEGALGSMVFLLCYLVSALGGVSLYSILNPDTITPLVGASGGVAGVMGMFAVLFGFKRINFFYNIFFYFNFIKLPGFIMFPFWFTWEVARSLVGGAHDVAYTAHLGGILTGAIWVLFIKHVFIDKKKTKLSEEEENYQAALEHAQSLIKELKFQAATNLLEAMHNKHPNDIVVLKQLYNLKKTKNDTDFCKLLEKINNLKNVDADTINFKRYVMEDRRL